MSTTTLTLTLTVDLDADAGYIDTGRSDGSRPVTHTVPIRSDDGRLHGSLDLGADGSLLGIEILGISTRLPGVTG